ncbi:MAG: histidine kinase [Marinifilaceae bacterium]
MEDFKTSKFLNNRILQHVIFWAFYLLLFSIRVAEGNNPSMQANLSDFLIKESIRTVSLVFAVYLNLRVLIPLLFDKDKFKKYFVTSFSTGIILAIITISAIYLLKVQSCYKIAIPYRMVWTFIHISMFMTMTSLLHFTKKWIKLKDSENNIKALRNEKLAAELESLKGQLNPHFLFNTLNNLYSLSLVKSDDAPNMILKLSDLMSYIIYDSRVDYISLNKEIEFTSNYISLEKIRVQEHLDLNVEINCTGSNRTIAPLLFMPFIENAFKYTSKDSDKSFINIKIEALENEPIRLNISNAKDTDIEENKDSEHSGLGIQNASKRLELIYPKKHSLSIIDRDGIFTVEMEINDL